MSFPWTRWKTVVLTTGREVFDDDVPSLSAAIAYYTVFSLPPLLAILVGVAGLVFGVDKVVEAITGQMGSLLGPEGARAIRAMIENASTPSAGIGGKLVGVVALLFGASGAFGQLQKALNRAWEVQDQEEGGIRAVIFKRLLSFGMVLTIAFFLLVSLAVSTVLAAAGTVAAQGVGEGVAGSVMEVANVAVSLGVITLLFAVLFRYLPDVDIPWRDVWMGAFVTAVLFTLGKTLIGVYLGTANPGSAFGAAGSLALILVWIYYSALIVLAGAEFTQAWAAHDRSVETTVGETAEVHPAALPREPAPYSGASESSMG